MAEIGGKLTTNSALGIPAFVVFSADFSSLEVLLEATLESAIVALITRIFWQIEIKFRLHASRDR